MSKLNLSVLARPERSVRAVPIVAGDQASTVYLLSPDLPVLLAIGDRAAAEWESLRRGGNWIPTPHAGAIPPSESLVRTCVTLESLQSAADGGPVADADRYSWIEFAEGAFAALGRAAGELAREAETAAGNSSTGAAEPASAPA